MFIYVHYISVPKVGIAGGDSEDTLPLSIKMVPEYPSRTASSQKIQLQAGE